VDFVAAIVAFNFKVAVAPYAGAWIEISGVGICGSSGMGVAVAPYAGAWIEILVYLSINPVSSSSLLMQERGLK